MTKIFLIGAGQIGSRHLQALAHLSEAEIWLYDVSEASLQVAMERFQDVASQTKNKVTCHPITDWSACPPEVDVALITTTAQHRKQAFDVMIQHTKPRYVVFEKVLFQRIQDLHDVNTQLKQHGIQGFVNFPRRQYPVYKQLKRAIETDQDSAIHLHVSGGQWGLACNGLHYIDLFCFLTGSDALQIDGAGLTGIPFESKRAGFFEVNGTLRVKDDHGNTMSVTCLEEPAPTYVGITTAKQWAVISEGVAQPMLVSGKAIDNWVPMSEPCAIPYQSQLSHLVVQDLLQTGHCDLATYDEALVSHEMFLNTLLVFFREHMAWHEDYCPIT